MAKTEFVKNYRDKIIVYDYNKKDFNLLKQAGYEPDEDGGICVEMLFGDGIAYDTKMNGIVMRYPTLAEVAKSEKMQTSIWQTTCREDIIPYDIALAFGRVGRYKYVLNYNEWIMQGQNEDKEVWTLYVGKDKNDYGHIAFDVFDDEYAEMDKQGLISASETEDGHHLEGYPTKVEINQMAEKYGILWTEWIGDHVYTERGYLEKVV